MTHGTTDYKDGLCRLTLDIIGPADSATYTCKATTAAGTAETTATVKVKGQRRPPPLSFFLNVER